MSYLEAFTGASNNLESDDVFSVPRNQHSFLFQVSFFLLLFFLSLLK